jgi:DNA-binding response OmpR family regulator
METRAPTRTQPALGRLALKRVVVAAPSPPPAVSERRALVVEGDRAVRDAICATLPRERFEVHAFADGDAAYEHGTLHGVDVAIIGKALPGIPGTVLCAMLRKSKAGAALSLVLTSPHYTHPDAGAGDCAAFGADQFIALPATPDALLERVDSALAQREPLERLQVLPSDLARLVDALFERLDASTYYQLLDVPFEAERAAIQQAFHQRSLALHPDRHARPTAGGFPFRQPDRHRFRALVVESEPVDQSALCGQAEHAGLRIPRLRQRGDRADFDKTESHQRPCGQRSRVLVHPRGESDRIGKADPKHVD